MMDDVPGVSLFQGTNINVENALQNQEEAEDIEDQIRRQEEIQNLLMQEMDDFNYDESSVNSSANVSVDNTDQYGVLQKYRDTSMNNQLKVLYEVRVREVLTLKKELEDVRTEFGQYKKDNKRQLLLLEADKDMLGISYKQAQDILVDKTEEINRLTQEIENKKSETKQLNCNIGNLKSDNNALQHVNEELQLQLSLSKEAITTNTITDRNILEQHQAELHRINISLDSALAKLDKKAKQNKELEQRLKEITQNRDEMIIEKSAVINKLTAHVESAQTQSQELLEVIEKLSLENQGLKKAAENNSSNDSTNVFNLLEKSEYIKGLQRELEKTQNAYEKESTEFKVLKESYVKLQTEYDTQVANVKKCQDELEATISINNKLQDDLSLQADEISTLRQKVDELSYIQAEKEAYDRRVRELEKILMEVKDKSLHDNAMQVTDILGEREELEKMEKDLNLAYHDIEQLNIQLKDAKEQIDSLSSQITLSEERDNLLKSLQEKAANFEKIIIEKQKMNELTTRATNTISLPDKTELLTAQYEADIIQKEIEIRKAIKNEFDSKYEKLERELLQHQIKGEEKCKDCPKLQFDLKQYENILGKMKEELKKTKQLRQEDRESIAKLLDIWKEQFYTVELQNQGLNNKYLKVKNYCDDLIKQIKQREDEEKKLVEMIKNEAETAVQYWHKQAVLHAIAATEASQSKIKQAGDKFELYSKKADKEIEIIELEFQRRRKTLEQKLKKYS